MALRDGPTALDKPVAWQPPANKIANVASDA
jgi:hypothetical protein